MDVLHSMLEVQAEIKVKLMKTLPEVIAHKLAADLLHYIATSEIVKEECKEFYKNLLGKS